MIKKEQKIFVNLKRPLNKSKNKSNSIPKSNQNEIKMKSNDITHQDVNVIVNDNVNVNKLDNSVSENINSDLCNKIINIKDEYLESEFEKLWEYYPNKQGKVQALDEYKKARKSGTTYDEIAKGLKKYIKYCSDEIKEKKYIKHGSTWFSQCCWKDDYTVSKQIQSSKSNNQLGILKGVYDGTIKIS